MNTDTQKTNADAVQELADALEKRMSRPAHPADHTAFELSGLLIDMYSTSPDDQPHERFLRLCRLVLEAFSDGDISAEAISKNPVTPEVMTYLLRAFADYAKRDVRGDCGRTTGRASALAESMLMSGGGRHAGKRASIWTLPLQMEVVSAGADAYEAVILASSRDDAAHARALKAATAAATAAACRQSGGALREFNSAERRAVRAKVTKLLAEHGYRSDWADRRVKS